VEELFVGLAGEGARAALALDDDVQKSPTTLPASSRSIFQVLGSDGSPGIVRISPRSG
jgi:hypothetical protein